jgi:hypothetical protein
VVADDISDFEIEGISIGDSLLDYISEEKIKSEIERTKSWYSYLPQESRFSSFYFTFYFFLTNIIQQTIPDADPLNLKV